jgi:hypothetical protein
MTPHNVKANQNSPDSPAQSDDPAANLHPDVRAVMQATQRLPIHDDADLPIIELPTEVGTIRAEFPAQANHEETAVIAVTLMAYLRDESAATDPSKGPSRADRWRLARQLDHQAGNGLRTKPDDGDAWKMAGRCQARR